MIDLFPPARYDAIITNAGGCGSHLRHYGHLLEDDPQYRDAARVWDAQAEGRARVAGADWLPRAVGGTV